MNFIRRHAQRFERWSSALLLLGLGYIVLSLLQDLAPLVAMTLVFASACFRALLFAVTRRRMA